MSRFSFFIFFAISMIYAGDSLTSIDSITSNFGPIDRMVITIPTGWLKIERKKIKKRIRNFKIQPFNHNLPIVLKEIQMRNKKIKRYVLVQKGKIIDPRSVLLQLVNFKEFSDDIYKIFKDVKKARNILATQCATSPIWLLSIPIITVPLSDYLFKLGINKYMNRSMDTWKNIINRHNSMIDSLPLIEQCDNDCSKLIKKMRKPAQFEVGLGYGVSIAPTSMNRSVSVRDYDNNTYEFNFKPKSFNAGVAGLLIGGRNGNLFFGMKQYLSFWQHRDYTKYTSTKIDNSLIKVSLIDYWHLVVGGYFNANYKINIIREYFTIEPGINAGLVYNGANFVTESEGVIITGENGITKDGSSTDEDNYLGQLNLSFGGPEIALTSCIGKIKVSLVYSLNVGYNDNESRIGLVNIMIGYISFVN